MGAEVHVWQVDDDDQLIEVNRAHLDLESRLEEWLQRDISILGPRLLVIGRQVDAAGGPIDLLCIDDEGDLVIVELKRDRTPREVTAQALDYASWVAGLSAEDVTEIASRNLGVDLEEEFKKEFKVPLPETLNADHKILVVGSAIDSSTERIIRYLSDKHGVNINAATFDYFQPDGGPELLARIFVIEPSEVEERSRTEGGSKRLPNLSYEELEARAEDGGVGELYRHAVTALGAVFSTGRTQNAITFKGPFGETKKAVIMSLLPKESSASEGLRFELYQKRFAEFAKLSAPKVEGLLPPNHELAYEGDPDWEGFAGWFTSAEEIDRLAAALN